MLPELSPWVASVTEGISSLAETWWTTSSTSIRSFLTPSDLTTSRDVQEELHASSSPKLLSEQDMEALTAETHDPAYPLLPPHAAPVVVAAASCESVVLRWQSAVLHHQDEQDEATTSAAAGFIIQRLPNSNHQLEWETLLDSPTTATDTTDRTVQQAHHYLYRVQAVSGGGGDNGARSTYAYHAVTMNQTACHASSSLLHYLPSALHGVPYVDTLSLEAVQTFVLIISCFLAVFGVVRANGKRVQRTRTRQGRLREMSKATLAETSKGSLYALPRLSSSEASTTDSHGNSNSTSATLGGTATTTTRTARTTASTSGDGSSRSLLVRADSAPLPPPPVNNNKKKTKKQAGVCHYCHKKFGLFRRRRVCDVCECVTLCRKCGSQAPVDCSLEELRESLHASRDSDILTTGPPTELDGHEQGQLRHRRSVGTKNGKVKTICHDCGEQAQRLSSTFR